MALASRSKNILGALIFVLGAVQLPAVSLSAKVLMGKQDALAWAFPGCEIREKSFVLRDEQVAAVETATRRKLDSRLVTVYSGSKNGVVTGYALIDIHNVRTLPEAFLVVLSPQGEVQRVRVLAFHEPPEYLPPARWLAQFEHTKPSAALRVGRDIDGIAGSTLSAQAVTGGVRRAIALYRVLVQAEE